MLHFFFRHGQYNNFRVAVLLPTAGENLEVVFKALVGSLSQRLWDSGLPESQTLRVVVLDEKRRVEVYRVCAGVHKMGSLIAGRRVRQILMVRKLFMCLSALLFSSYSVSTRLRFSPHFVLLATRTDSCLDA